jgi:WXG100 family type VII secretion target
MAYDPNDVINLSLAQLRAAGATFQQASQSVSNLLAQLNHGASQLRGEMSVALWLSPQALGGLQQRWNDSLQRLTGSLETLGNDLNRAAATYETTDQEAGQEILSGD